MSSREIEEFNQEAYVEQYVVAPRKPLPRWLKGELPSGEKYSVVRNLIEKHQLHTICSSGNCPNRGECWSAGTATFMILGDKCTRNCHFCSVKTAIPDPVDWEEAGRVAEAISVLKLKHAVITSVTRDDLPDGGASFWAFTIQTIKERNPGITLEVLIPDFLGNLNCVQSIMDAGPEIISHNIETVWRLTPRIRNLAVYRRSLDVLAYISSGRVISKSGIMLGHGERRDEVLKTMRDLRNCGVRVITIGQYLQPSSYHTPVVEYVDPQVFTDLKQEALSMGFDWVESGALVRSSYHSEKHLLV